MQDGIGKCGRRQEKRLKGNFCWDEKSEQKVTLELNFSLCTCYNRTTWSKVYLKVYRNHLNVASKIRVLYPKESALCQQQNKNRMYLLMYEGAWHDVAHPEPKPNFCSSKRFENSCSSKRFLRDVVPAVQRG